MGDNMSQSLSGFRYNVKASAQHHVAHLFPVPVSANVNRASELNETSQHVLLPFVNFCVDCFQEKAGKLDDTRWFESLMFYAFRMGDDSLSATDQDVKLVPSIIEKVVISKLTCKCMCSIIEHRKIFFLKDLLRGKSNNITSALWCIHTGWNRCRMLKHPVYSLGPPYLIWTCIP